MGSPGSAPDRPGGGNCQASRPGAVFITHDLRVRRGDIVGFLVACDLQTEKAAAGQIQSTDNATCAG